MAADQEVAALGGGGENPVVVEATKRFRRCADWETDARENFLNDYKFRHGDAYNGYQWPNRIRSQRDIDNRPCLTMNIIKQHNLQIINEAKQNKSAVAMKATGGGASKKSADMMAAIMRQIEYESDAQQAYSTAQEFQVDGGWGWIRLVCEYEDERSFNQVIRIKRVWDPLSVYIDPDCSNKDKSDARFGFVFDLVPDELLEEAYPDFEQYGTLQPLVASTQDDSWNIKDHTRVCEYFRKVKTRDVLISFIDPGSAASPEGPQRKEVLKSRLPGEVFKELQRTPLSKWRDTQREEIEWYLICGQQVLDKTIWPGKYIPLIKVFGEESIIEGKFDCKGHTRSMLDAQRMYNYNASAQVEFVALQGKTPWVAAAQAIEEYEYYWNSANVINHSVLPFNSIDDEGNQIPPPIRQQPPSASPAYETGMQTAFNQMMMTSGQWQNQMGMQGNERTGEAISRRQEQGFTAVYHFQDNYAMALRLIGKMVLDLVPRVYDTKRLLMLKMEDGEDFELEIDPGAKQVYLEQLNEDGEVVRRVLNPALGRYDVEADVGPAYGTRREETVKAMTLLLTQAPQLVGLIGDLLLSAMQFKEAQEAGARLKRMVPAQALGKGPTQMEQQLQAKVVSLQGALAKALQQTGEQRISLKGKEEMRDIDVYKAETDRMSALQKQLPQDAEGLAQLIHQLTEDSLATHLTPIIRANAEEVGGGEEEGVGAMAEAPPVPGAKKAGDGKWYIRDPARTGKYLRIEPRPR